MVPPIVAPAGGAANAATAATEAVGVDAVGTAKAVVTGAAGAEMPTVALVSAPTVSV